MRTHLLSQILLLTATLVVSVAMIPAAQAQTAKKPNILVIWGDDIGTENISYHNRGMMG
jgi:arylsulfatase